MICRYFNRLGYILCHTIITPRVLVHKIQDIHIYIYIYISLSLSSSLQGHEGVGNVVRQGRAALHAHLRAARAEARERVVGRQQGRPNGGVAAISEDSQGLSAQGLAGRHRASVDQVCEVQLQELGADPPGIFVEPSAAVPRGAVLAGPAGRQGICHGKIPGDAGSQGRLQS